MDSNGAEAVDLIRGLKKADHEVMYWVGLSTGVECEFPEIIFQDHETAREGKLAPGIDPQEFEPASEELLKALLPTEALIYTMMKRKLQKMFFQERRHIYYEMVRYWQGVLKKFKIDAVIFTIVPHAVYSFLIYSLAKLMRLRTIMFEDTPLTGRALMYQDFWEGSRELQEALKRNQGKKFTPEDLSEDVRSYYLKHKAGNRDLLPFYIERKPRSKWNVFLGLRRQKQLKNLIWLAIRKRLQMNLKKEYKSLQVSPEMGRPYIYVALNYQPERATSPQGKVFNDQILMLENLSSALPTGWAIYVKEHPMQWPRHGLFYTDYRYPGYYQRIVQIKNVFLLPVDINSYDLVRQAKAVAVVTGTPGWDGVLRGKPALVFGVPWYRDCPGIFRVNSAESCRKALAEIQAHAAKVNEDELMVFLKSFDDSSIRCYIDDFAVNPANLSVEERIQNMLQLILPVLTN